MIVRESRRDPTPEPQDCVEGGGLGFCFRVIGTSGRMTVEPTGLVEILLEEKEEDIGLSHGTRGLRDDDGLIEAVEEAACDPADGWVSGSTERLPSLDIRWRL